MRIVVVTDETLPRRNVFDQLEVVGVREGGLTDCYAPLWLIDTEDVPFDLEHVQELAASFRDEAAKSRGGTGQLKPVLLGEVDGDERLHIIDGFHRCAALKLNGSDKIYATVKKCDWEDVIDLRIRDARIHKTVEFARIVDWINNSWDKSPWADKVNVTQALVLFYKPQSHSEFSDLSQTEIEAIKDWVKTKCSQWKVPARVLYDHLSVASVADPQLVRDTRFSEGGRALAHITPSHLKVIAKGLPLRYDLQRLAADLAKKHNLRIAQTRTLVSKLSRCEDADDALTVVTLIDWSAAFPRQRPERKIERSRRSKSLGKAAVEASRENVLDPAKQSIARAKDIAQSALLNPLQPRPLEVLTLSRSEIMALGRGIYEVLQIIDTIIKGSAEESNDSSLNRKGNKSQESLFMVDKKVIDVPLEENDQDQSSNGSASSPDGQVLLRSIDVAILFDVTERTVINWAASDKIPVQRTIGGHLRFRKDDVDKYLEELRC